MTPPSTSPWGDPPWRIDAASTTTPPPVACEVAVVGGGFTGLSAAWHLARRGVRVVLLEATRLGAGASGRTGGIVLEGTAAGELEGVEHCLDALASVVEEADIDCQLRLTGCRELEHRPHPGGPPPCWRDGDSWLCHADTVPGGTIDPGALVGGLAHAARAAGAALHEAAAVHALERGRTVRLHTTAGQVRADHVVIALNAWTTTLLELPIRFDAALTLAVCTAPLAPEAIAALGLSDAVPFYTLDLPYLWGRMLRDGRLILGAGLVGAPDGAVARVRLDDPESVASLHRLMARLPGFHPALDDVEITHRWGGPIAFPASRTPVLGRLPDAANVIVSGGCAGHGIALGIRAGQLVADAIVDGTPLPSWGALPGAPQNDR